MCKKSEFVGVCLRQCSNSGRVGVVCETLIQHNDDPGGKKKKNTTAPVLWRYSEVTTQPLYSVSYSSAPMCNSAKYAKQAKSLWTPYRRTY